MQPYKNCRSKNFWLCRYSKDSERRPGAFDRINLDTSEAKVTIKDSGGISIRVEDELNAFLEGTGNLVLKGEPRLKSFVMPKE